MQMKRLFLLITVFLCLTKAYSQSTSNEAASKTQQVNIIKLNLTALPLKNYSLQYERTLNRKISFAVAFRTMPGTTLPFKSAILKQVNDGNADTRKTIESFELSNYAITPEIRFYLSKKGFGRGFYIAPFYRYASFKTNTLNFDYEGLGTSGTISLSGKLTANTGGLAFGAQWFLGRHLSIDWWILGHHYGSGKGDFEGLSSRSLTAQEQSDLRQQLEDLNIPFTDKTVNVTANSASLKLDGPWAGVRAGILLGFRF
jgi:hypothetical protein